MFQHKPFSINYLGKTGSDYEFFVRVGNINEIIYGTTMPNNFLEIGGLYTGVFDAELNLVTNFKPIGEGGPLADYVSPIDRTITLTESGPIYLKIPRIPIGSGSQSGSLRPLWFATRLDVNNTNTLMWHENFEIVSEVDINDFLYYQRYDVLENGNFSINYPKTINEQVGYIYIKIAQINIEENSVTIIPFFRSNIINPSRYITTGINYTRNLRIHYTGKVVQENSEFILFGDYSRPSWIIKTYEEIFASCKTEIETDINAYLARWDYNSFGKADFFQILSVFGVYISSAGGKILVKNIFEVEDPEGYFLPLNEENLPLIISGANLNNTEIV